MMIALDLDDIHAVAARAAVHLGVDRAFSMLDPTDPPCCRGMANNRLFLRRWAAGRPAPGEGWSYRDHLHLVDHELAVMGASPAEAAGCRRPDCHICTAVPRPIPTPRVDQPTGRLLRLLSRAVRWVGRMRLWRLVR